LGGGEIFNGGGDRLVVERWKQRVGEDRGWVKGRNILIGKYSASE